ncbi:tRNA (guanosine(37)-N1)-methyltransferase TrmD [Bdellovibrio bacteriovorus]|uniref:tRNA (guanosine(37)-N1)-methyltransferase TrmD n=1 Tax=Bdellovibrio bacteriovorus TaxID=959 RepID=UPI00045BE21B|nr:tRNA (guanosine(37)-N1)-methyltransferase TrmD [Bdellovibrio bacteriovorus]AHZ84606.1 tRNA (guanine-N1)-methyltransferase [Bdellovibrio bacteriovorus]BEV68495.1 tRNA (guanine-N(1)-)-methyltransferase [Bdellovibrio bacteriovorus]
MLKIDVITLFPEMIQGAVSHGVLGQALKGDLLSVQAHTPREFATDKHRTVDDRPFGGGDGMIMLSETLEKSIQKVQHKNSKVIYLSPQGSVLTDDKARELSQAEHLVLICGRYGGIDQRIINTYVDEEISIGDYVLSGGELGALVVIDALSRFIPGVLGHVDSADKDSFSEGLLEHPNFTRPREYLGQDVPEVLLSGNHKLIADWKEKVSALVTLKKRPDLFIIYLAEEREKYRALKKKKTAEPLKELFKFWQQLSPQDREVLGLEDLNEESFNG